MPHLKIEYTPNIEAQARMEALCKKLARTLVDIDDGQGRPLFPFDGTRVLACPATYFAVADGEQDKAFVYLNLRIAPGRSAGQVKSVGEAVLAAAREHLAPLMAQRALRVTFQIDVGNEVYEGKLV